MTEVWVVMVHYLTGGYDAGSPIVTRKVDSVWSTKELANVRDINITVQSDHCGYGEDYQFSDVTSFPLDKVP